MRRLERRGWRGGGCRAVSGAMSSTQSASIPGGVKATSGQLAAMLKGELRGPADVVLSGFGPIDAAGPGDLTFIRSDRYALQWAGSRAGAVSGRLQQFGDVGHGSAP